MLDLGAYDGFFTFEAERRGAARVVALDRHPTTHKGFALAHELLRSKAEYVMGSLDDLSREVHGSFDVGLVLEVLDHLRDPLLALEKNQTVCRETLLVESHVLDNNFLQAGQTIPREALPPCLKGFPLMQFHPDDELNHDRSNWRSPTVECLCLMIESCGFQAEMAGQWANRAAFRAHRYEFSPPFWY